MCENKNFLLHKCCFEGDYKKLSSLLLTKFYQNKTSQKDKHGNTPLHLAVMLGRKECISLLLEHGAIVKIKNSEGWSPLAEAISYGDRPTISLLVKNLKQQSKDQMEKKLPNVIRALKQIPDFYLELKWDFHSWVPFVTRVLPSDICKIHKCGSSLRLDTTLVDFSEMRWERGDISFIFQGDKPPKESLTVLDNEYKYYQRLKYDETDAEIENEVDILMSNDILSAQMSMKNITFSRAQSGWFFREERKEIISEYECDLYNVNGLVLESRKRREHLSKDDLQKNKEMVESFTKENINKMDQENQPILRRNSLKPPQENTLLWADYMNAEPNYQPQLGRELIYKESSKSFKATVFMTNEFPLSVEMLLNVLEITAPFKHFDKLREFVKLKLPTGFPIKIEIPILRTIAAQITFQKFEFKNDIPKELFEIPEYYVETTRR